MQRSHALYQPPRAVREPLLAPRRRWRVEAETLQREGSSGLLLEPRSMGEVYDRRLGQCSGMTPDSPSEN